MARTPTSREPGVVPEVTFSAEGGAPAKGLQLPECLALRECSIMERTTLELFAVGGEDRRLSFKRFYWLGLLYSKVFHPSSQTCCADSTVPRASRSLLGMGFPVPTETRPNKRQLPLAELCGARLCSCARGSSPGAGAWPRARGALQWSDPRLEQGPSDPGCGIRCLLER